MNNDVDIRAHILAAIEDAQSGHSGARLGASQIGHLCDRKLWAAFRWARYERIEGRILRLFEVGRQAESRIIADLRTANMEVLDIDPQTGRQWEFTACNGHVVTKLDGVLRGVPACESTWHLLEIKTANASKFRELRRTGIPPRHMAQMHVSMTLAGLNVALYVAENKNDSDILVERVYLNDNMASALLERAQRIVFSNNPPPVNHEGSSMCKWCAFAPICSGDEQPSRNCRTCTHAQPVDGGQWLCTRHDKTLTLRDQDLACDYHAYIPSLLMIGDRR